MSNKDTSIKDKKKIIITIPVYKIDLTTTEKASLQHCAKILNPHQICLLAPKDLDVSNYENILKDENHSLIVERFDNEHFKSRENYSYFCLDVELYNRFSNYEYMFFYQLDGWVFSDKLNYWCDKNFDYIGAPHFENYDKNIQNPKFIKNSGNGGVSLRKVKTFISVLSQKDKIMHKRFASLSELFLENFSSDRSFLKKLLRAPNIILKFFSKKNTVQYIYFNKYEDYFIAKCFKVAYKDFKIAPPEVAMFFSFEGFPAKLYEMTYLNLPFACHAFENEINSPIFWKGFIKIEERV